MAIQFANPYASVHRLETELLGSLERVLKSGQYILGPELAALESEFASYIGTSFAIGVANGTDALALALRALDVSPGDEVITVSMTAVATVAAIEMIGARPVLVDVQADCYTMNPRALLAAITPRTRAVIPVHLYGHPATMGEILSICDSRDIAVIEDCSQAHGAVVNGKRVGSHGKIGAFSCYPTKNLGALGDAGLLTTNDPALASKLRSLRQYGWEKRNWSIEPGVNSRLDEMQAAVLRVKLQHLDELNLERSKIAAVYQNGLTSLPITLPQERLGTVHAWHLYTIALGQRDLLQEHLYEAGIATGIYYPFPIHLQPAYRERLSIKDSVPITEQLSHSILSLPLYPGLQLEEVENVIAHIREFFN